jgi:hypothetical protein
MPLILILIYHHPSLKGYHNPIFDIDIRHIQFIIGFKNPNEISLSRAKTEEEVKHFFCQSVFCLR